MFSLLSQHVHGVSIKIWTRQAAVPLGKESRRYMYYDYWNDREKNATNKLLCDSDYRSENNLRSQQRIRWYTDSAFILIIFVKNVKTLPCRNLKIKFSKALVITYQKKIKGLILSCDYKYFSPPIPQKTMLKFAGIVIVPDWTTLIRLGSGNWGDAISWDGLPVG